MSDECVCAFPFFMHYEQNLPHLFMNVESMQKIRAVSDLRSPHVPASEDRWKNSTSVSSWHDRLRVKPMDVHLIPSRNTHANHQTAEQAWG